MIMCDVCLEFEIEQPATTTSSRVWHRIGGTSCRRAYLCERCAGPGLTEERVVSYDCVRCAIVARSWPAAAYRCCKAVLRRLYILRRHPDGGPQESEGLEESEDLEESGGPCPTYRVVASKRVERFVVFEVAAPSPAEAQDRIETLLATAGAVPVATYSQDYDEGYSVEHDATRRVASLRR